MQYLLLLSIVKSTATTNTGQSLGLQVVKLRQIVPELTLRWFGSIRYVDISLQS